jgi:hypothetical protein
MLLVVFVDNAGIASKRKEDQTIYFSNGLIVDLS